MTFSISAAFSGGELWRERDFLIKAEVDLNIRSTGVAGR